MFFSCFWIYKIIKLYIYLFCRRETHFECDKCGKEFNEKAAIRQHVKIHLIYKCFSCVICNKTFKTRNEVTAHKIYHSNTKNFECNVCQKKFHRNSDLKSHELCHKDEKNYKCEICEKNFKTNAGLRKHQKLNCINAIKSCLCDQCGKMCSTNSDLKSHIASMHSSERNFSCLNCPNKIFKTKSALRKHANTHGKTKL